MTKPNRLLLAAGYGLAALLVVVPVSDTLLKVLPIHLGEIRWRFGAAGLMSNVLMTPLFGLALGSGIALFARNRRILRALSVLVGANVLFLLAISGNFVFDALQMRSQARPEAKVNFDLASVQALLKMTLVAVVGALLAIGAWRASRRSGSAERTPGILITRRRSNPAGSGTGEPGHPVG